MTRTPIPSLRLPWQPRRLWKAGYKHLDGDATYSPNSIFEDLPNNPTDDGRVITIVYAIPMNVRLTDIREDPRWAKGLQTIAQIVNDHNTHNDLVNALTQTRQYVPKGLLAGIDDLLRKATVV